jgi:hypothetical protein
MKNILDTCDSCNRVVPYPYHSYIIAFKAKSSHSNTGVVPYPTVFSVGYGWMRYNYGTTMVWLWYDYGTSRRGRIGSITGYYLDEWSKKMD